MRYQKQDWYYWLKSAQRQHFDIYLHSHSKHQEKSRNLHQLTKARFGLMALLDPFPKQKNTICRFLHLSPKCVVQEAQKRLEKPDCKNLDRLFPGLPKQGLMFL